MSDHDGFGPTGLCDLQVEQFIRDGFVRIDQAFPKELAQECCVCLWRETGCDPNEPSTWTKPVIRISHHDGEPFDKAVNTPTLHAAFDRLVGKGRWRRRRNIGGIVIRFPHPDDPRDTGWHVDRSFPAADAIPGNYDSWRVNLISTGRALLMLFLFSDVGEKDAPTRIRVGSHRDMARALASAGDEGLPSPDLDAVANSVTHRPVVLATGEVGTVYLCHPFLVHAAQRHQGTSPRILGQPPLHPEVPFQLYREDDNYPPVERAIRLALEEQHP